MIMSDQETKRSQGGQTAEVDKKGKELWGQQEMAQMDEPGAVEGAKKDKPDGKKTPEEVLAGTLHQCIEQM